MKKTLLSIIMLSNFGLFISQAQITINDTHLVNPGDIVEQASDTLPGLITIGSAGTNQTWDFSSLSEDELDTLFFKNPSTLPGSANFPIANMVLEDTKEDSSWVYLDKNTSGLFGIGIALIQQGILQTVDFPSTIITFPSTMGTSYNTNGSSTLLTLPLGVDPDGPGPLPTIDSTRVIRTNHVTSNIDGWGDVITPFGTFASLRQIVIEEEIDSTWIYAGGSWSLIDTAIASLLSIEPVEYDTSRSARWWTDDLNAKFPLVEMDYNSNGTANDISWLKSSPTVSLQEVKAVSGISLYPNPATNKVTIENKASGSSFVEIIDITGKLVSMHSIENNKVTFQTVDLNNGTYLYKVYDKNHNVIHSDKFTVLK